MTACGAPPAPAVATPAAPATAAPPAAGHPASRGEPGAPSIPPAPSEPAPAVPAVPAEPVSSLHVDCTSIDSGHDGESLRGWHMGGPAGGSFNWYGSVLACTVELVARCEENAGNGRVRLSAGSRLVADRRVAISGEKTPPLIIEIPAKVWERALERDGPFIYERLQVVARLDVKCEGREAESIHLVDGFVGGFGGGE
jgi:hypothetical protein